MLNNKAFLYKITNKVTGESYIGITRNRDVFSRWHEHLSANNKINKAFNQYGITNFTFEIIKEYTNISNQDLFRKESCYINKYNSINKGYNTIKSHKSSKRKLTRDSIPSLAKKGLEAFRSKQYLGTASNNINNKKSFWRALNSRWFSIVDKLTESNYLTNRNSKYYNPLRLIFSGRKQRYFKISHFGQAYALDNLDSMVDFLSIFYSEFNQLPYKLIDYTVVEDCYQITIQDKEYGKQELILSSQLLYEDELTYLEIVDDIRDIYKEG